MSTPHNSAKIGDFAKTVLMPGDPLRSKFIAENFLTDPVLVNNVRGVQGYTGTWKGTKVSVMASGMGMPAIGIYSWELYKFYDVESIIRVGSAGAMVDDLNLLDLVIAEGACTDTNYGSMFELPGTFAPVADFKLLSAAVESAKELGAKFKVGNILSSDNFYLPAGSKRNDIWRSMGVLAVEMESAALYMNAAACGKRALCICSISDHLYKSGELSPEERQTGFSQMIETALNTAVKMAE
jgi:purine-nucleoside phosphorylase